ncbi:Uncharacterised protein [Mycobacterium tuberculosis]|nr:Uncharacterised protein [Mycobacterium tuberculosis]
MRGRAGQHEGVGCKSRGHQNERQAVRRNDFGRGGYRSARDRRCRHMHRVARQGECVERRDDENKYARENEIGAAPSAVFNQ